MILRFASLISALCICSAHAQGPVATPSPPVATIANAIAMVRIQHRAAADGSVGAFSPDGRKFALVVWRGDLARNVNLYSLLVVDLRSGVSPTAPRTVLTREFVGDPLDQQASPIQQICFLADNRTITFLGLDAQASAQVFTVDIETREVRQLSRHPSAVRHYALGPDKTLRAYSAIAEEDDAATRRSKLEGDGVFLWDGSLFETRARFMKAFPALTDRPRHVLQYFLAGASPRLFFDSRQSRPAVPPDWSEPAGGLHEEGIIRWWVSISVDPTGRRALLYPYGLTDHPMRPERYKYYQSRNAFARRTAAPYGIVDLSTGRIERLIDAPRAGSEPAIWGTNGRSVILQSLLPIAGDVTAMARAAEEPPQWIEVDLATRTCTRLPVPEGWRVLHWDGVGTSLVLRKGNRIALLPRRGARDFSELKELGTVTGLSSKWQVATDGRVAIGVRDSAHTPPELVSFDLTSGQTTTLTQLNPELHRRRYGDVEPFRWSHRYDADASALLVKPVDYRAGVRYPLVVLLDDGTLRGDDETFLLDGAFQLSGNAVQMLAAQGFMVLYAREPHPDQKWLETPQEGGIVCEHIETAISALDRAGLIDPRHVGISGWSRAAYHTNYLLIHSAHRFAAATLIDGGAAEYNESFRPFTDEELRRIRTPILFEPHRVATLVTHAAMADRLEAMGKPAEILYFATASHSTTRPQHRFRSLDTHVDWWRFWLRGEEDPDPKKAGQYARWHTLRELHKANLKTRD